jgi:hypothetical protein
MNNQYETQFLFVELNKMCRIQGMMMQTQYFGDKDQHLIKIICNPKNVKIKQIGYSLNNCLTMVYETLLNDYNHLFSEYE